MSGLVALSAGGFGLGAIVEGAVNAGESVYQLSTKFGITAKEASELNRILKLTGSDTGTFATAMLRLDKSYSTAGEAGDKCRAVLDATGVSLTDSNGKLLPLNQQLQNLSKGYNLATASGQQEEFIMNTLGARGMALVGTLKNLAEAKEDAAKVTGAGLDPQKMHDLKRELDVISLQSTQVGLAFTGALAPVATELFPPIMSGLKSTAEFLVANKTGVIELTKDTLELAAAYKGIQLLSGAGSAITAFFTKAAADAAASTATQIASTEELTVWQEKAIKRRIAASDAACLKEAANTEKTTLALGLSAEESAAVITAKYSEIAIKAATTAEEIRTTMTAAFLSQSASAAEAAITTNTAIASTGITAIEAATVKTTATTESAALCTVATAESATAQIVSLEEVGAAATLSAEKSVAANAMAAESAGAVVLANEGVATSHVVAGNAAILAGEKTVGAMAIGSSAVGGMLSSVWALIGGWYGVAAAIGYSIYKLQQWHDEKNKDSVVTGYDEWGRPIYGNKIASSGDYKRSEDSNTMAHVETFELGKQSQVDLSGIAGMGGTGSKEKKTGKSDEEKELEKLQKEAQKTNDKILKDYQDLFYSKTQIAEAGYAKERAELEKTKDVNTAYDDIKDDQGNVIQLGSRSQLEANLTAKKRVAAEQQLAIEQGYTDTAIALAQKLFDIKAEAIGGSVEAQNKQNEADQASIKAITDQITKIRAEINETTNLQDRLNKIAAYKSSGIITGDTSSDYVSKENTQPTEDTAVATQKIINQQKDNDNVYNIWKANLDKQYNAGHIQEYQQMLNDKQNLDNNYLDGQKAYMSELENLWKQTNTTLAEKAGKLLSDINSGLTSSLTNFISGTESGKDAFSSFASSVINSIIQMEAQATAATITSSISKLFNVGTKDKDKTNTSSDTNSTSSNSLLTTGITLVSALFKAGGGAVYGAGTGTSDSIPAMLSHGEYVLTANTTKAIGVGNLDKINKGYATGGLVTGTSLADLSNNYSNSSSQGISKGKSRATGAQNHVTMNIYAQDVRGAKQSQSQMIGEAYNAMNRGRRNA